MSSILSENKGSLLVTYLSKGQSLSEKVQEEFELKCEIVNLLKEKGYRFIIADQDMLDERLLKGCHKR